jgi:hypothetical protein
MEPNTTYIGVSGNEERVDKLTIVRVDDDSGMAEVAEHRNGDGPYHYVKPLSEIQRELTEGILRES